MENKQVIDALNRIAAALESINSKLETEEYAHGIKFSLTDIIAKKD